MHRERSLIKLGKPFLLKGNFILIASRKHMLLVLEGLHVFLWRNKKDISIFLLKKAPYLELCWFGNKQPCYLGVLQ